MHSTGIQVVFFQHIRGLLPKHIALVDAVADILDISNDSAYRRIRGEKPIAFEEMQKLAGHFRISLDQFLHLQTDTFIFSGKLANASSHIFEEWTRNVLEHLRFAASFRKRQMFYLAKDIPLMQQFLIPELAAFKSFFWRKSILHYEEMRGMKFSLSSVDETHLEVCRQIIDCYNQIDSTDIWNIESMNSTIRQIEFYRETGVFASDDDAKGLYQLVLKLVDHIEKQAETGMKFCVGKHATSNAARYNLYINELILGDNSILFELDNARISFINHSVINFIHTRDEAFTNHTYDNIQNLIKKSTSLSISSEKERTRFFNKVREKLTSAAKF